MLAIQLAAELIGADLLERIQAAGHPHVRFSHGFVFQQLVAEPRSIGEIAAALGVTSQAVSQSVAELERLGYVERRAGTGDARRRLVTMTARGQDAVATGRAVRAALRRELEAAIGERRVRAIATGLTAALEARGAMDEIAARRVRPVAR